MVIATPITAMPMALMISIRMVREYSGERRNYIGKFPRRNGS
jgi:hypothetical protein